MNKKFAYVVCFIIVALFCALPFAACEKNGFTLEKMSELTLADDVFSWGKVDDADYYSFKIMYDEANGYETITEKTTYPLKVFKEGTYRFSVRAHKQTGFTDYSNEIIYVLDKDINSSTDDSGKVTYKGAGTKEDPILISTAAELLSIKTGTRNVLDGEVNVTENLYYKQVKDIDLEGAEVAPFATGGNKFSGHYDGDGHVIKNFVQNKVYGNAAYTHVGLFGSLKEAEVINLVIENYSATISSVGNSFDWGVIAGYAEYSDIKNVKVDGRININSPVANNNIAYVGMLVGESKGNDIERCSTSGSIICRFARSYAGGIAGITKLANTDMISDCSSTVDVTTYGAGRNDSQVTAVANSGGIVGYGARIGIMNKCYYSGSLVASAVDGANVENVGVGVFGSGNVMTSTGRSYLIYNDVYFNYEKLGYSLSEDYPTADALAARYAIGGRTTSQNARTTVYCFDNAAQKKKETFAAFDFDSIWTMGENGPVLRDIKVEFKSEENAQGEE